jgi:hypothetical protein
LLPRTPCSAIFCLNYWGGFVLRIRTSNLAITHNF